MAKYKPGDRVIVGQLIEGERYYMDDEIIHDCATTTMAELSGKVVTIAHVSSKYLIEEDSYNWVDGMFVGLADECVLSEDALMGFL